MPKSQLSWVRSQHPPTQWNLRGGRWSILNKVLKNYCFTPLYLCHCSYIFNTHLSVRDLYKLFFFHWTISFSCKQFINIRRTLETHMWQDENRSRYVSVSHMCTMHILFHALWPCTTCLDLTAFSSNSFLYFVKSAESVCRQLRGLRWGD